MWEAHGCLGSWKTLGKVTSYFGPGLSSGVAVRGQIAGEPPLLDLKNSVPWA